MVNAQGGEKGNERNWERERENDKRTTVGVHEGWSWRWLDVEGRRA